GLVAGATIQIGDRLIDGSVRTQLDRLRQRLTG
ncbi:MAG: F0F1 ATP synthase subunit delta, partial [Chloroflexi bacterium]